jgi:hypothetical protein
MFDKGVGKLNLTYTDTYIYKTIFAGVSYVQVILSSFYLHGHTLLPVVACLMLEILLKIVIICSRKLHVVAVNFFICMNSQKSIDY